MALSQRVLLASPFGELAMTMYGERNVYVELNSAFSYDSDDYTFLRVSLHLRQDKRWQVHDAIIKRADGEYLEKGKERRELTGLVRDAVQEWARESYAPAAARVFKAKAQHLTALIVEDERQLEKHCQELAEVEAAIAELESIVPGAPALAELLAPALTSS